jgi:molybdopterin-guanine dinucleotide biosynthesis protein A
MGFDKSLLQIDGKYVISIMTEKLQEIFSNISLSAREINKFSHFNLGIIQDIFHGGIGPAAAVHGALTYAKSQYVFVVAVDMPFVNIPYIRHMMELATANPKHAIIPLNGKHKEAMYGFYSVDALPILEAEIKNKNFAMHRILEKMDTLYIDEKVTSGFDKDMKMFTNLNYVQDLDKALNGGFSHDK